MSPWPFVLGAYGLGLAVPIGFGLAAFLRARTAKRRLVAVEAVRR